MWVVSFYDDHTYQDLYDLDCSPNNHGEGHGACIQAVGRTKKEAEKEWVKNQPNPYQWKSIYHRNRYARIMWSKPHNRQLLIYEV